MPSTVSAEQVAWATRVRSVMATYRENEELIRLGAYKKGTDPEVDAAILANPSVNAFLRQGVDECTEWKSCLQDLGRIAVSSAPKAGANIGVRSARTEDRSGLV